MRSAPGSLASRVDAFDDDNPMFLLVAVPTIRRQCLHPQCRNVGVARRCRRNLAAFGPKQTKLLAQFFPIAVSGNDELMIDAGRCPERIVECVKEAPTLSSVKAFSSGVAGCAMEFRLKYPILP